MDSTEFYTALRGMPTGKVQTLFTGRLGPVLFRYIFHKESCPGYPNKMLFWEVENGVTNLFHNNTVQHN